jgi:pyridoxal phosphate enzyme (YggS family)
LAVVRRRITEAGGDPDAVRVVAVTKGFPPAAVAGAAAVGLRDVGENYAGELTGKAASCKGAHVRWHFLGAIQRNKVKSLAPIVDLWQSVARLEEGRQIARYRPGARVLVQVDLTGREERNGCAPAGVPALVEGLRAVGVDVEGLMTVAPVGSEQARRAFAAVRELADRLELRERSMGMSDDLEEAVAEGTTMVRVGRALFGERPEKVRSGG